MRWLAALALLATPALAEGEPAGAFDYYILSLSWSPGYCALEGDARGDKQCDPGQAFSFTLHGLWPQFESGWPSYCRTAERDPSRRETRAMADIMGSAGLAWYQWKKHGRCSGLAPDAYFDTARRAYGQVRIPELLARLDRDLRLPAEVVEEAFIEANPGLAPPMITITCKAGRIQEARICLTRDLGFRPCGADAARDCRMPDALLEAVR
ncbi:ribonuclease T2 [Defluviimonas salinarum]|uniref:Ribonuclease T2 n=1 Tax=Defluviimonas salinarum TaxID=2992147 RepID=A0ABT3J1Q9_9RHOB|nr:ribonuclease T2 [Defluviimonas salinarum]MCW3781603.1 ribonuclease T2 [Defluviimonas salinarum]